MNVLTASRAPHLWSPQCPQELTHPFMILRTDKHAIPHCCLPLEKIPVLSALCKNIEYLLGAMILKGPGSKKNQIICIIRKCILISGVHMQITMAFPAAVPISFLSHWQVVANPETCHAAQRSWVAGAERSEQTQTGGLVGWGVGSLRTAEPTFCSAES